MLLKKNIYNFFSIIIVIMAIAIIYLPFYFKFQLLPQYENFSKGFEFEVDSNHKALIKFDSINAYTSGISFIFELNKVTIRDNYDNYFLAENINFEINPLTLLLDGKKTPNNLQIFNAVLFIKNKFKLSNDDQKKMTVSIFDFLHNNTDFSISNLALKIENEGTISYYDIDALALKKSNNKISFYGKNNEKNNSTPKFDFVLNATQIIQADNTKNFSSKGFLKYYGNSEYIYSRLLFKTDGYPRFQNCQCEFWFGFDGLTNKIIPYKIKAEANEITHLSKNQTLKFTDTKFNLIFNHKSDLEIFGAINFKENDRASNFKISFSKLAKDFAESNISSIEINELNTRHLQNYLSFHDNFLSEEFIKDLNIKYLKLNNLKKNNFFNEVSGLFESNKIKINGLKKIFLDKNSNQIKLSLFKTSEINSNKNTEKKQNILNLVQSLDIFASLQEKQIKVKKFRLNLDDGYINGQGSFESGNDKITGKIILKSKRLSILENLIVSLDVQNKTDVTGNFLLNKFVANNINSEININYFLKEGDVDYKIEKLSVFIEELKAQNIKSKNVFYLNNGKVDYRPKNLQGIFNNFRINDEIFVNQLNAKYFEENRYEVEAKTIETNTFSFKKLAQDLFPKFENINLQLHKNPNDKLVFNNLSLKSVNPGKFLLDSKFNFNGIHLALKNDSFQFKNLNGNGIIEKNKLQTLMVNGENEFSVFSAIGKLNEPRKHFEVNASSAINFDDVFFDQYFNYDIKKLMNGKLKFNSKLIFSEKKIINYEVFSDLKGLGILLPDPFKKNNTIQKDFTLRGKIEDEASHKIDVKYGSDINSNILYKDGNFYSSINIGVADNKIPSNGLVININENEFNLDKWVNFFKSINSKSIQSNKNFEVNIKSRALIMVNRYFNDVDLQIRNKQGGIYTIINSPRTVGKLNLKKVNNQDFINANFEKLHINEAIIQKKIKKLPPSINLTCNKCSYKEIQLGSISLEARNTEQNIFSTDTLKISNNDFELIGKLSTSITDNEYDNYGDFDLIFDNFGQSLSRLKITDSIEKGKGLVNAQIKWKGNKVYSFLYSLSGNTNIDLKSGFFKKIDPGVGKLLGIFSLQSIPKRLLLDFSDVYKEGFYFDKLIVNADISDGIFRSDDIKMLGPSGSLSFDGEVDMRSQTQNLNFIIYPTITTAAALAGAVINPAVGIATFVIQKLFKDPIEKKAARMYKVTGTWSKPQITKIEK